MTEQTARTKDDHKGDILTDLGKKLLGPSWRTTVLGLLGAVTVAAPIVHDAVERGVQPKDLPGVFFAITIAVFGRVAKDGAITGSSRAKAE